MKAPLLSLILLISIFSFNCKENGDDTPPSNQNGSVEIAMPTPNTIYDNGFVMRIEGQMTDNNFISSARVEVRNKTTGAILYQQNTSTPVVSFYRFLWNWTISGITSTITATVKVTVVDQLGNQAFKEVDVMIVF